MILSQDAQFKKVLQIASNIASSKATVLICGESGTGKELLARFIHEKSSRHERRLIAINCAAVPEGLLESELFGYERGAFTGAVQQKMGKVELAHQSTLLLDEISEMPLSLQAKLLRVLQEEEIDRLGGKNTIKVDIRVIATTNRDLRLLVKEGKFREDLYYRLNVITLQIPALRLRPFDVALLSEHFLKVSAILNSRNIQGFTPQALQKLQNWNWPGNVRELENVIERAVLLAQSNLVDAENIVIDSDLTVNNSLELAVTTIAEMEKKLIYLALEKTNNNKTRAAEILGISIRTLRNKLNEYNLKSEVASG
ncbi:MAG: sigma-54-dependent Fis family transcriptional regulator [Oligoflexia bacterium]|nr:sigma-54-dependent Fis family transcriptional regulator [Oligoflexia bacterium]